MPPFNDGWEGNLKWYMIAPDAKILESWRKRNKGKPSKEREKAITLVYLWGQLSFHLSSCVGTEITPWREMRILGRVVVSLLKKGPFLATTSIYTHSNSRRCTFFVLNDGWAIYSPPNNTPPLDPRVHQSKSTNGHPNSLIQEDFIGKAEDKAQVWPPLDDLIYWAQVAPICHCGLNRKLKSFVLLGEKGVFLTKIEKRGRKVERLFKSVFHVWLRLPPFQLAMLYRSMSVQSSFHGTLPRCVRLVVLIRGKHEGSW